MDKALYDWLDEMENKEYSTYDYIKKLIKKEKENNMKIKIDVGKYNTNCDCCKVIIGGAEYTIINEKDTQLFICQDCLTMEGK